MVTNVLRRAVFGVLGMVLLCMPATAFAVPLVGDQGAPITPASPEAPEAPEPAEPSKQVIDAPKLSKDVVSAQKELLVSIGHDTITLSPNTSYEIFLDNTSLGTHTSDANGQLFVQVKIPQNTTPALYELSVRTPTSAIQKTIEIKS